jgi:hypothetical protein
MNDIINTYIQDTFNPELEFEIRRTLWLFECFQLEGIDDDLSNLLMSIEGLDRSQAQDDFIAILNIKTNFIFISHTLKISDRAPIHVKNELLSALFIIQDLSDYTLPMSLINGNPDIYFAVANVLALYCTISVSNILNILEQADVSLLQKIQELDALHMESDIDPNMTEEREVREGIYKHINAFLAFTKVECLGYLMVTKGYKVNYPLDHYLPLVKNDIVILTADGIDRGISARESIANNIVSLVLLSEGGYDRMKEIIDDNLSQMVPNVTPALIDVINNKITTFKEFCEEHGDASNDIHQ